MATFGESFDIARIKPLPSPDAPPDGMTEDRIKGLVERLSVAREALLRIHQITSPKSGAGRTAYDALKAIAQKEPRA